VVQEHRYPRTGRVRTLHPFVEEPGRASLCLDRLDEALALTPFIFIYTYKVFRDR
jgi:hypothetical protein